MKVNLHWVAFQVAAAWLVVAALAAGLRVPAAVVAGLMALFTLWGDRD